MTALNVLQVLTGIWVIMMALDIRYNLTSAKSDRNRWFKVTGGLLVILTVCGWVAYGLIALFTTGAN